MLTTQTLILFVVTTTTSAIAGIAAMGGGIMLVLLLPYFLPMSAIIPIHGVAQLASNSSRLAFAYKHIVWPLVWQFLVGALVGVICVGYLIYAWHLADFSNPIIPILIAVYLLLTLWVPVIQKAFARIENFYFLGAIQSGLGLLVGAPGPMTVTLLYKRLDCRDQIVATASVLMAITNANKIVVFTLLGFAFYDYVNVILACICGAILGSFIGTHFRHKIPSTRFLPLLKWLITLLACHMLVTALLKTL